MRRHLYEQHIGNAHGRIALWLDETEAIDLAHHYGPSDLAYGELMAAVERAYPPPDPDEWRPGIKILVSERRCPGPSA